MRNPEITHKIMSAIKSKDTNIEILLRKGLWRKGIRYRKNMKVLNCHPDIVIRKYKIAIFCDGDFWHGREIEHCRLGNNAKYWQEKIKRNVERDLENTIELRDNGWTVLRFWETDIKKNIDICVGVILREIELKKINL